MRFVSAIFKVAAASSEIHFLIRPLARRFHTQRCEIFALRADFVGANRDEVALPTGQTDISLKTIFMAMKYPG